MAEEIKLTPQELEELKDDIKFKTKTILTLKHLCTKLDKLNNLPTKVSVVETKIAVQWGLLSLIITLIIGLGLRVLIK